MHRRRYLYALGATLLAGCASPDGDQGQPDGGEGPSDGGNGRTTASGPPTLAFGESYLLSTGVEVTCSGVETADAIEMDGESVPAPDGRTWLLVELRAENVSEESRTLPWRQAIHVRLGEERFQHDVNDVPAEFLFWDRAYNGGDPVDPGVVEEGVVPIPVDPALTDRRTVVMYRPIAVDVDTEVWWTGA